MVREPAEFLRVQTQLTCHLHMQIAQMKPPLGFCPGVEAGCGLLHDVSCFGQPAVRSSCVRRSLLGITAWKPAAWIGSPRCRCASPCLGYQHTTRHGCPATQAGVSCAVAHAVDAHLHHWRHRDTRHPQDTHRLLDRQDVPQAGMTMSRSLSGARRGGPGHPRETAWRACGIPVSHPFPSLLSSTCSPSRQGAQHMLTTAVHPPMRPVFPRYCGQLAAALALPSHPRRRRGIVTVCPIPPWP